MIAKSLLVGFVALCALGVASSQLIQAIVSLKGDNPYIVGNITLSQSDNGPVAIWGKITGLRTGKHGFHIHEKGDITGGCGSTGSHYNPHKKPHGALTDADRHIGDLGNINASPDGVALVSITDSVISLRGPHSILGRSIVVHADADDLGKGGFQDSLTTGHAGGRLACGVIGILTPLESWPTESSAVSLSSGAITLLITVIMQRLLH
uniref:Superoxide dismutase [Cu-Zn] n=1 Tax=Liposcelis entomophila TaxID=550478 RepID=A0A8F2TBV0_9NEOP|nr:CuZn superoxide dismutase [Liposcelis entomophila]